MSTGTLKEISLYPKTVEWTIPDFLQLPKQVGYYINSPEFTFLQSRCWLRARPNGTENSADAVMLTVHCIDIHGLVRWDLEVLRTNGSTLRNLSGTKEDEDEMEFHVAIPFEVIQGECCTEGFLKVRCTLYNVCVQAEKKGDRCLQTEAISKKNREESQNIVPETPEARIPPTKKDGRADPLPACYVQLNQDDIANRPSTSKTTSRSRGKRKQTTRGRPRRTHFKTIKKRKRKRTSEDEIVKKIKKRHSSRQKNNIVTSQTEHCDVCSQTLPRFVDASTQTGPIYVDASEQTESEIRPRKQDPRCL